MAHLNATGYLNAVGLEADLNRDEEDEEGDGVVEGVALAYVVAPVLDLDEELTERGRGGGRGVSFVKL